MTIIADDADNLTGGDLLPDLSVYRAVLPVRIPNPLTCLANSNRLSSVALSSGPSHSGTMKGNDEAARSRAIASSERSKAQEEALTNARDVLLRSADHWERPAKQADLVAQRLLREQTNQADHRPNE